MKLRDHCKRSVRYEDGTRDWMFIPRCQCTNEACRRIHRVLPDFLTPFKHYPEETISGVLDGVITPSDMDSEDHPSETTMKRWHHWLMKNKFNIEGHMRSIGFRELGFSEELLKSGISLLAHLRSSIPDGWLSVIIRFIYNTGNRLVPVY